MANWFYAIEEEQLGPVASAEIERLIAAGDISANTLIWKTGMGDWELAAWHFEFDEDGTPPPVRATPVTAPDDPDIGPDGLYVGAPSREFVEAAKVCLSKYATFSGRASRSEFWFFYLFYNVIMIVAQMVDVAIIMAIAASGVPFFLPIFTLIAVFGMFIPLLAVSWRRLHDIDRTGWWLGGGMLAIVLLYGLLIGVAVSQAPWDDPGNEAPVALLAITAIFMLAVIPYTITIFIFYVTKGTLGRNRFG